MSENAKPRRRCLRFSLKTLLIVVVLVSVGLGWFVHRAERQRRAVEALRAVGGEVRYDFERYDTEAESPAPVWLTKLVGKDFFADAVSVFFSDADDVALERVSGVRAPEVLVIVGAEVADAGLNNIKELTTLDHLWIVNTQITDTYSTISNVEMGYRFAMGNRHHQDQPWPVEDVGLTYVFRIASSVRIYVTSPPTKLAER